MSDIAELFVLAPLAALLALGFAWSFYRTMCSHDEGTDEMKAIAGHVRDGANAYLMSQFRVVAKVVVAIFVLLCVLAYFKLQNPLIPVSFLTGAIFSALCGFLGMRTATMASARTAQGARESLNRALQVSFRSGAVMGLVVVGFGLLNIAAWYWVLYYVVYTPEHMAHGWGFLVEAMKVVDGDTVSVATMQRQRLIEITTTMMGFGIGASLQALFARVGGGIFTKAADVGADLVGKLEAGIPEDDPRNAAVIADNVGDNVGDVAGMGADLYESYCGSILATAALGAVLPVGGLLSGEAAVTAPMVVAAFGIILSIFGVFLVQCKDDDAGMKTLLHAIDRGIHVSSALIVLVLAGMVWAGHMSIGMAAAIVSGLAGGIIIGISTSYYTSDEYKPTQGIAEQAKTGAATTIIDGMAVGMFSAGIPVLTMVAVILCAFSFAGGLTEFSLGVYGIGFAAVGMLSTLGITLATDAYGPIADNAGGNAEMAGLPPEVRERTDALDMLGNTTAAIGKGFAIGSAALTALALLATYVMGVDIWADKLGMEGLNVIDMSNLDPRLSILDPRLLCGLFLGGMVAFVFCAMTMKAVGRAAGAMVEEVRRQFKEIPGIMDRTATPDYARCVEISTQSAQKEMIIPSILAVSAPVLTGLILGVGGVLGLLAGGLATGFSLACMLNNSGGAWDNAKKYVEKGNLGGKGSDAHKACVVGDTVGDPFKDTSGPSLNILIKLMSMVSIIATPVIVKFSPAIQQFLHLQ